MPQPVVGVLAVVWKDGRVLLVRRANPPQAGEWGFPGGRLHLGETASAAALRELREETGVDAQALETFTAVDLIDRDATGQVRYHYVLLAVLAIWRAGVPRAQDDVTEAGWFRLDALPEPLCEDVEGLIRESYSLLS